MQSAQLVTFRRYSAATVRFAVFQSLSMFDPAERGLDDNQ